MYSTHGYRQLTVHSLELNVSQLVIVCGCDCGAGVGAAAVWGGEGCSGRGGVVYKPDFIKLISSMTWLFIPAAAE